MFDEPLPATPDPDETVPSGDMDPEGLKEALGRTGRMLKTAGLPFEIDEFDEEHLPDDLREQAKRDAKPSSDD